MERSTPLPTVQAKGLGNSCASLTHIAKGQRLSLYFRRLRRQGAHSDLLDHVFADNSTGDLEGPGRAGNR